MPSSFTRPLSDFLNSALDAVRFRYDVQNKAALTKGLLGLPYQTLAGGVPMVVINFKAELDPDEVTALDEVVAAHTGKSLPNANKTVDGTLLMQPQVQTHNWQLCDRDIKVTTCTVDPATAVEDLRVDLATLLEAPWDECTLVGVFKLNQAEDGMEPVINQSDANANGILSVFEYKALNQNTNPKESISWEIRDGGLIVDPDIADPAERYAHRFYAIGAPDLAQYGGCVRFFDGYMPAQPDGRIESKSPQAKRLDPEIPGANVVRFYVYHPAGSARHHLIRVVTYRELGTV